ncbi:thioesterase [Pseudofrankia asymbiotica]|uniref:Thioesterase n=1 Tax=Pseudofrankia asymbiotica TaxID=1834516 RepID=A0A1V2I6M2_9ACTN|nr:thioesterase [Pseudofrankia asymbiotica]
MATRPAPRPAPRRAPAGAATRSRRPPPLFLVGGLEGPPHPGLPLAGALSVSTVCRGLDLPGRDGARTPLADVRAMAVHLLPSVLLDQPGGGPYQLGGYGFGGVVAYELGRLLRGLGQPVARVFLFDAALPLPGQAPPADNPKLAVRELARMRHLACVWQGACRCGVDHGVPLSTQGAAIARALGATDPDDYEDHLLDAVDTYAAAVRAYAAYSPPPSDLPVVLIRPANPANPWGQPSQLRLSTSPCLGWENTGVADLTTAVIPGDHITMFANPYLWDVATIVQRYLFNPQPAPRSAPAPRPAPASRPAPAPGLVPTLGPAPITRTRAAGPDRQRPGVGHAGRR